MNSQYDAEIERLQCYAEQKEWTLTRQLGLGQDGIVFVTSAPSAVKALRYQKLYAKERDVYLRLQEKNVQRIGIFNVPSLISYDDDLWIVEMTYVAAPFVVDFAGAYLDTPPPYHWDDDMMTKWQHSKQRLFNEDWWDVVFLLKELREVYGIYLNDVKPGNVTVRQ